METAELLPILKRIFHMDDNASYCESSEEFGNDGFLSFRKRIVLGDRIHLFLKCSDSSRDELKHMKEFSRHYCKTECVFYGFLMPILCKIQLQFGLQQVVPEVFFQKITETGTVLVMENLVHQGFVQAPENMSLDQVKRVVVSLAHLQASYWIARSTFNFALDDVLGKGSKLEILHASGNLGDFDTWLVSVWEYFSKKVQECLIKEDADILFDYYAKRKELLQKVIHDPCEQENIFGLVSGDLWYTNVFFRDTSTGTDCRIFDWQFFRVGSIFYDLGIFLISSTNHEVITMHFDDIVNTFYDTFKFLYENSTCNPVPMTYEEIRVAAVDSLHNGMFWSMISSETLWTSTSRVLSCDRVLKNAVAIVKHFGLKI